MEHASRRVASRSQGDSGHDASRKLLMKKYGKFMGTLAVSWVAMYFLAFSQIERVGHFHWSLSVFWISLSMISSMGLVMLFAMRAMLPNKRANIALFAVFAVLLVGALGASRAEAGVGDDAFLRSMIPHHSRAIHMCEQANLADPEVVTLCGKIVEAQREEIAQMEQIMARRG